MSSRTISSLSLISNHHPTQNAPSIPLRRTRPPTQHMRWRTHNHNMSRLRRERTTVHTHTHIQAPFPSKPIPTYLTNTIHTTSTTASICETCQGRGFNVFVCAHCNPALAEALREAEKKEEEIRKAVSASAADAAARSGDSTSSASRMGPHWRRFGDGGSGVSGRS